MRNTNVFLSLFNEIQKGFSDLLEHLHCLIPFLLTFYVLSLSFSTFSHLQSVFCEEWSVEVERKHQKNTRAKPK